MLRNADGVGVVRFSGGKHYEGVRFNVISVTRAWVGGQNVTYHLNGPIFMFSSTHFFPLWMVDANFIFILVFISSYLLSVWHPFDCFVICMVYLILSYFILCCFLSTHFHHVHSTL